ncbi:MAG: ABC transporter permease [Acidimicrobiales bacterium]|nr:ABC transporter permease [Acidimicrobiales bacterium]
MNRLTDFITAVAKGLTQPRGLIVLGVLALYWLAWYAARKAERTRSMSVFATLAPAVAIIGLQVIYFPMPAGVYALGIILGTLGALVAVGMALIYRANRILNFAQGDLGLVPTVLAVDLIVYAGLNYFLAFFIGAAAAIVLGAVIELAIIRRFFRAPRLILTVATIGLSQLLLVGSILIPTGLFGKDPASLRISLASDWSFEIPPIVYRVDHLVAIVVAPIMLAAIAVFLRYTNVGIAIRASAERADRASLLGVPVKRLQTVVWVIATILSFVGVFLRASVLGLPVVSTPSYVALLLAIAALMLGKLTELPTIGAAAVALGILEQAVVWNNSESPELFQPILALVIVVGLLVRKTGQSRTEHDTVSTWQSVDEVRPVPKELRKVPEVVLVRWGGTAVAAALLVALPNFGFMGPSNEFKAAAVLLFAIIGMSLVVLTGWAGQVSLGQMSFVAVGAGVGALATKTWGLDLFFAMIIAGIAGALVAVVVGLPALRLRGLFLAVTTLAFAVTMSTLLLSKKHFDWIPKDRIERKPLFGFFDLTEQRSMYYLCLVCFVLAYLALRGIRRSRTGRVLLALRENERGVQSFGVNVTRAKLTAFALSGFMAAFAGAVYVHLAQGFDDSPFAPDQSFAVFTSTVVGGLGSLGGGPLGALYFNGGTWFLKGLWTLLPSALGVLFVLMVLRGGLGGLVFSVRDAWLRSVARRNGIIVPSLVADIRQDTDALRHAEASAEQHDMAASTAREPFPSGSAVAAEPVQATPEPASGGSS